MPSKLTAMAVVFLASASGAVSAASLGLECRTESGNVRRVDIDGDVMTVVNPKTPRIVFAKRSEVERRGNIVRYSNDAWDLYVKEGIGQLKNKVFGDEYTCLQFRGSP